MSVTVIVAVSRNGVIGRDGTIPWHVSADLRRFKEITTGHPVIMGRRTWDSIGRPLPGRHNIVLSRDPALELEGATVVSDVDSALAAAADGPGDVDEVFVIGGAEIYRQTLPVADRVLLTRIEAEIDGDTRFPEIDEDGWEVVATRACEPETPGGPRFTFLDYRRRR